MYDRGSTSRNNFEIIGKYSSAIKVYLKISFRFRRLFVLSFLMIFHFPCFRVWCGTAERQFTGDVLAIGRSSAAHGEHPLQEENDDLGHMYIC